MPEGWLCVVRWSRAIGKCTGHRPPIKHCSPSWRGYIKPDWPIDIVVFPPYVYLPMPCACWRSGRIMVGAQDVCAESGGAFTGQVGAAMLKDVGCSYVHRRPFGAAALVSRGRCVGGAQICGRVGGGLTPVLCVGETLEEREAQADRSGGRAPSRCGDRDARNRRICRWPFSLTSRCGRSAPGVPPRRNRRKRCTRSCAVGFQRMMLRWRPFADSLRRQRQGRQCGRTFRHARRGWWIGGWRFLERR